MDFSVVAVTLYKNEKFSVRIGLDSRISEVKSIICTRWLDFTPTTCNLYVFREEKKTVIDTDSDLQSLACFVYAKGYGSVEMFGEMCSNIAESFNSWIGKERYMPITSMLDTIRVKIMDMMTRRREKCNKWKSMMCPKMEKRLVERIQLGRTWKVTKSADDVFEVHSDNIHCVDLKRFFCSCNVWTIETFPSGRSVKGAFIKAWKKLGNGVNGAAQTETSKRPHCLVGTCG
ncbi:hypothetical protein IFM89_019331 [Coptis chinensis]|uniref:Uncharacterized protein n=1 Tax=Coptis chinensis TaxID=261450 RepID=A0A835I650_9MAGN|nr:hypothetical protein IFM89_019331 [Coptis chinensis]